MQNFISKPILAVARTPVSIAPGTTRITADQYEELLELNAAWDRARAAITSAHQEADAIREQYREEGLAMGRADAQKEQIEQVAQMQASMNEWVKDTDTALIELVNRCVGEVVNKIDPTVLVAQSVEKGLAELASAQNIIVRVHPDTQDMDAQIADLTARYGITGQVRLVQDGTLEPGDAIVESPVGTVDLRIANQLKLIGKALKP